MRFDPEQQELRRTVRTLLERAAGGDVWRLLAEQVGALGLAIPEEYGGAGFSVLETHVVLEELGAALAAPGFLSTTLAAQAILAGDAAAAKAELLPGIAGGGTRATVVWGGAAKASAGAPVEAPVGGSVGGPVGGPADSLLGTSVVASAVGGGWRLTGAEDHVLDAGDSDLFVVPARMPAATGLFVVAAADATVTKVETVDPGRPQARVAFQHSPAQLLSSQAPLDRILDLACVALSAEQVGAAQRAFDLTLAYAKQRVQFGRPIGSFQAVKHRLADMYTLLESARSASYGAAFAAASGHELTVAASRAKAYCSEAFGTIAGEAIQLHGGIGITWEHPIHLYFKRAHATSQLFGTPAWHRRRYAAATGLAA
ncbi:alkylation response protein AidB-like acyl-CoA dehydrogenase [Catenulispora sp. GP43]|uniref:acyl-CoA dehydrogenase family protein n=1 Tax=Catenulispora sp. GP43 TaxID=3156263 RepID=UPI0035130065